MDLENNNDLIQNLKDAACSAELIQEFFRQKELGNNKTLVKLLYKHKKQLLEDLHYFQKKIDCLDYLIFQINKSHKKN